MSRVEFEYEWKSEVAGNGQIAQWYDVIGRGGCPEGKADVIVSGVISVPASLG